MLPSASFPHSPTVWNPRITKGKKTIFYGFVTTKGMWVHNQKGFIEDERYKLGFGDVLHAMMSVAVFLAIAFSDHG